MMSTYRFVREAFGDMPVKLLHLDLYLNFLDDVVEASNCLDMETKVSLDKIELDANNLEILDVRWGGVDEDTGPALEYDYLTAQNRLVVHLGQTILPGTRFKVRTRTRCVPSDHILEGIYRDITPPGAPQTDISQCQQWGFQWIMPIFDDCRAKCTMTTTIEADAAYRHLITNGNISRTSNPDAIPVPKPEDPSRQIISVRKQRANGSVPLPGLRWNMGFACGSRDLPIRKACKAGISGAAGASGWGEDSYGDSQAVNPLGRRNSGI